MRFGIQQCLRFDRRSFFFLLFISEYEQVLYDVIVELNGGGLIYAVSFFIRKLVYQG